MTEQKLPGGNAGGAIRIGSTVRRPTGPWTPAVHALLQHVQARGFAGSPQVYGIDEQGREVLSYLDGEMIGTRRPWPAWVHSESALDQVADWLRAYHRAVADFVPPEGAVWREGGIWRPGLIIGHNDAAPYNACWRGDRLQGFFDWDLAAPVTAEADLAFTTFGWVPLHARNVVTAEGFTDFASRPRRLRRFLDRYGWSGNLADFLTVVDSRIRTAADTIRRLSASGDPLYGAMLRAGSADGLDQARRELPDVLTGAASQ